MTTFTGMFCVPGTVPASFVHRDILVMDDISSYLGENRGTEVM
jgi:hypothetical protein